MKPNIRSPRSFRPLRRILAMASFPIAFAFVWSAPTPAQETDPPGVTSENGARIVGDIDPSQPYSPAIMAGDFLYLSGAIGLDRETLTVPESPAAETQEVFDHLSALLESEGLDFGRIVEIEPFLSDMRWRDTIADIWRDLVPPPGTLPPASTAVEAALVRSGARLEMAMTAVRQGVEVRRILPEGWPDTSGRPFSWGVLAGDTLFLAGMIADDPASGRWVGGDIEAQTRQAMTNVASVLAAADMNWDHVARCRVFLADARDYTAMNGAYGAFLGDRPPARSTVQARLVLPAARVEIQCVAVRDEERKVVLAPGTEPPDRPFSPSIQAGGRLFLAGMVGRGPHGYPAGVEAQTRVALDHAAAVLGAAGLGWRDVVSARVFLSDVRYYAAMNRVYKKIVGTPAPARTTVGTPLAVPEALVEIELTAVQTSPATE